jgi:hypothetical protein
VPTSNNRVFAGLTLKPSSSFTFANDFNVVVQEGAPSIALPNTPGEFHRRDRFYGDTASATWEVYPPWTLGLGYSYQQNNLNTYMAFQNDSGVGYVLDQPSVPYRQISQSYWGETTYLVKERLGLNLRVTYNSARSGYRPDLNPNDAPLLGNAALISGGTFDPVGFAAAQANLGLSSTLISEVIVPQWVGQSKVYYLFPRKLEGGLVFYYGSYRDYFNPNLNGVLRTFNVYLGRSW